MKQYIAVLMTFCALLIPGCDNTNDQTRDTSASQPPVLKSIIVTGTDQGSITIDRPGLTTESGTADTITAYIGRASAIQLNEKTVSGSIESGIDLSDNGHCFTGLTAATEYTIIVIAENRDGYDVRTTQVTTNSAPLATPYIFCSYESKYVHLNAVVQFTNEHPSGSLYIGSSTDPDSDITDITNWQETAAYTFNSTGQVKLFAKIVSGSETMEPVFSFTYEVVTDYPNYMDDGLTKDDPSFQAWADGHLSFTPGLDRSSITDNPTMYGHMDNPEEAYGPATGDNMDVVVLGNNGELVLSFSSEIRNGTGYDFAVFENSFGEESGSMFAELGYVEVSSDGINFVRFDSVSRTSGPVGAYGNIMVQDVYGLCSKHPNAYGKSYGTPFDLDWLKNKRAVLEGTVDLNNIRYVKIIDISGAPDDSEAGYYPNYDSFGNIIYDAYKTWGTGGIDLEAIGVINTVD